MLKKYKQLFVGFVIGLVLASSTTFGASVIRNSYFNDSLNLAINGHQVEDMRIVTVEIEGEQWGRNYYSIADLVKALNDFGGISAKVDFDSNTKTTVIDVEQKTVYIPESSSKYGLEGNKVSEVPLNKYGLPDFSNYIDIKSLIEGNYQYINYNGVKYINISPVPGEPKLLPENYRFQREMINGELSEFISFNKYDPENRTWVNLIEEVPHFKEPLMCISYDYYQNTILPLIEGAE